MLRNTPIADPGTDELQLGIRPTGIFPAAPDGNDGARIEDLPVMGADVENAELELGGPRGD